MTGSAMDEFAAALRACEVGGIAPERICRAIGAHQPVLTRLMSGSTRVAAAEVRIVARRLRQVAMIVRLERGCQGRRYEG